MSKNATNVNKIDISKIKTYQRIDWQDGITPINADNLNSSENALHDLLGDSDLGHIQVLCKTLNQEIDTRTDDVSNLIDKTIVLSTQVESESRIRDLADKRLTSQLAEESNNRIIDIESVKSNIDSLTTSLDRKIESASIQHTTDNTFEGVRIDGTNLHIVVDAYTKQETIDNITRAVEDAFDAITGGESAVEVKQQLDDYKAINDLQVSNLSSNVTSLSKQVTNLTNKNFIEDSDDVILYCGSSNSNLF